jgi:type II secretory pathway pseudopilin PulG
LLIVVAIIAILAAIAVPNFLEAQARSKVSACMNDMRAMATAIEAYCVDANAYPPYGRVAPDDSVQFPARINHMYDRTCFAGPQLTTPIAYITAVPADVFAAAIQGPEPMRVLEYLNLDQHVDNFLDPPPDWVPYLIPAWGHWRLAAAGPDGDRGTDIKLNVVYDPTNGTISDGDIVRCQQSAENQINPLAR